MVDQYHFDSSHYSTDAAGRIYGHDSWNIQDGTPPVPGNLGILSSGLKELTKHTGTVVDMAEDVAKSWGIQDNGFQNANPTNAFAHVWMSAYESYKYGDETSYTFGFLKELDHPKELLQHGLSQDSKKDLYNDVLGIKLSHYAQLNNYSLSDLPGLVKKLLGSGLDLDQDGVKERAAVDENDPRVNRFIEDIHDGLIKLRDEIKNFSDFLRTQSPVTRPEVISIFPVPWENSENTIIANVTGKLSQSLPISGGATDSRKPPIQPKTGDTGQQPAPNTGSSGSQGQPLLPTPVAPPPIIFKIKPRPTYHGGKRPSDSIKLIAVRA